MLTPCPRCHLPNTNRPAAGQDCPVCRARGQEDDLRWFDCLGQLAYPVDLQGYRQAGDFPGRFCFPIAGDRAGLIAFARHVQAHLGATPVTTAGEITYWKQASNRLGRHRRTAAVLARTQGEAYLQVIRAIIGLGHVTRALLSELLGALGTTSGTIAEATASIALADPSHAFTTIDRHVAGAVNERLEVGQPAGEPTLIPFTFTQVGAHPYGITLDQVHAVNAFLIWARVKAEKLARLQPGVGWCAHDVELTLFTARRSGLHLP